LRGLGEQWKRTGASVDALVRSPEILKTFDNVNLAITDLRSALADVHRSLAGVDSQVSANGQDLHTALKHLDESLKEFTSTAVTVRRFVAAQQNLGTDADKALTQLGDAAESVQRLADFIERNPNAL